MIAELLPALALFFPAFSGFNGISQGSSPKPEMAGVVEAVDKIQPRALIKINTILKSHRPEISESESWRLSEVIFEESSKRQLDPLLVTALIKVESGFKSEAISPMGARGMMQIMPETGRLLAQMLAREYGFQPPLFTPDSLDDPVHNLRLGIYYLHDLKKQFRHLSLALTAYNFGPADTRSRLENNLDLSDEFANQVLDVYKKLKPRAF